PRGGVAGFASVLTRSRGAAFDTTTRDNHLIVGPASCHEREGWLTDFTTLKASLQRTSPKWHSGPTRALAAVVLLMGVRRSSSSSVTTTKTVRRRRKPSSEMKRSANEIFLARRDRQPEPNG